MRARTYDYRKDKGYPLDLNQIGNRWAVDVSSYEVAGVVAQRVAAWGTAVLTVYMSPDGYSRAALATPVTLGPLTAGTHVLMSGAISTQHFPFLVIEVSTAEGSAAYADLVVTAKTAE